MYACMYACTIRRSLACMYVRIICVCIYVPYIGLSICMGVCMYVSYVDALIRRHALTRR
jgi:hypothetical protein